MKVWKIRLFALLQMIAQTNIAQKLPYVKIYDHDNLFQPMRLKTAFLD
jgi:hypothetical protein